ncbi:carboxymuconolactone decarboxylase family protein [Tunturiibacter lichenicola]
MRASQINGCAYCIDLRSQDARSEGETGTASGRAYQFNTAIK